MKKLASNNLKIWQALTPAQELEEIQNLMPIDPADYERLKADIKKNGFRDPLKVYQKGTQFYIIGGLNRWKIAQELKHRDPLPVDLYQGTAKEYRELAIQDNLNRRQLTEADKINLIGYLSGKGVTISQLAEMLDKSERQIKRLKALYRGAQELAQKRGKKTPTKGEINEARTQKNIERKTKQGDTVSPPQDQQKPTESGTGGTFKGQQRPQEAPGGDLQAPDELGQVRVFLNPYELSTLEGIIIQAIKDEYSTPAKKKTLEAIRRKLSQARREG